MPGQHNIRRAHETTKNEGGSRNPPLRIATKAADERLDRAPEGHDVWVWSISLNSGSFDAESPLPPELTIEEKARAERYKVASARQQFATCRACLRTLLGQYLRLPPHEVPIAYSGAGKPMLADLLAGLHFSVSHSHELAVIAVARRPVGIDIEHLRALENPEGLVRRFFSQAEQETYLALPTNLREAGFFRGWTSKEAIIKARGLSIACLADFDVELHPERPAGLLAARHCELTGCTWRMTAWAPAPGYAATVALEGG
jgi:4'-phosphopantetheinyl transferase